MEPLGMLIRGTVKTSVKEAKKKGPEWSQEEEGQEQKEKYGGPAGTATAGGWPRGSQEPGTGGWPPASTADVRSRRPHGSAVCSPVRLEGGGLAVML